MSLATSRAAFPDPLRQAVDDISRQLCSTIDLSFMRNLRSECDDESVQGLISAINFVITSTRRTLAASKERDARLEAVLETVRDGVLMIDEEGRIESLNTPAATMFGYQIHEVKGFNISKLIPSPHAESCPAGGPLKQFASLGEKPGLILQRQVDGLNKSGARLPLAMALSKVWLDGQRLLTAVLRDLSHERLLQCELAQAQKLEAVGQLAAGIAHEINTPTQYVGDNARFLKEAFDDIQTALDALDELLTAVKAGRPPAELIEKTEATLVAIDLEYLREEIPQAIRQSLDGVGRVANIVRAMREFSHPGSDEKSFVDLRESIETTLTVARNEWKYVAEVVTEFDPELPEVPCLPGELNQVILNLVVNSAHAIADVLGPRPTEKGTITIGTRREGSNHAVFYVKDTGTGIPETIRAKIFDPFFTTKEVGKGTGQGLAIARSVVVDKHGGAIECETAPGQGTTFTVRLPLEAEEVAPAQEVQAPCE